MTAGRASITARHPGTACPPRPAHAQYPAAVSQGHSSEAATLTYAMRVKASMASGPVAAGSPATGADPGSHPRPDNAGRVCVPVTLGAPRRGNDLDRNRRAPRHAWAGRVAAPRTRASAARADHHAVVAVLSEHHANRVEGVAARADEALEEPPAARCSSGSASSKVQSVLALWARLGSATRTWSAARGRTASPHRAGPVWRPSCWRRSALAVAETTPWPPSTDAVSSLAPACFVPEPVVKRG